MASSAAAVPASPPALPARTRLAVAAGRATAAASRLSGAGGGSVIGGRVALRVDPKALARLSRGRVVTLVSGTNGKTTTTRLLSAALASRWRVASNAAGSNMPAGLVAAAAGDAEHLVLEVDEPHLPAVIAATEPAVVVLLNLSRDQLDRVGETRRLASTWRASFVDSPPSLTVVANADDPLLVWAAATAPTVRWAAAGQLWHSDAPLCPSCGAILSRTTGAWTCGCGRRRPEPEWRLVDTSLVSRSGVLPLRLQLPGRANRANAVMAAAGAAAHGVELPQAVRAMRSLASVSGRYLRVDIDGRSTRLLLSKNPAGWIETLDVLADSAGPVVVAVNAEVADGRDTSWLWDVPFERLRDRRVVASGQRRLDIAMRLSVAGIDVAVVPDPVRAVGQLPAGAVDVVANYTAFRQLLRRFPDVA